MNLDNLLIGLPWALGLLTSSIWPGPRPMTRFPSPIQPPGWVFGLVWPILYLVLGWAWLVTRQHALMAAIMVGLNGWLISYHYDPQSPRNVWILTASQILGWFLLFLLTKQSSSPSPYLVLGLISYNIWLSFATQLNIYQVNT